MSKDSYLNGKRKWASIAAAVILSVFQLYAFIVGLQIGENRVFVGGILWFALFLVQMVGNDFAQEDTVFRIGWLFSYVVEITAGTWAIYALLGIPDTSMLLEGLRWLFALGLSGVVALLPERLLLIAIAPVKHKTATTLTPSTNTKPSSSTPSRPAGGLFTPKPLQQATKYDPLDAKEKFRQELLKDEKRNL
jgi:hypothetical protein